MSADSRMSLKLKGQKASFRTFQCHQTWGVKCTTDGGSKWFEQTFLKENSLERRCKGCGGSANELLRSRIYWSSQSSLGDQQEDEDSRETTTVNYWVNSYITVTLSCIKNKILFCFDAEKKNLPEYSFKEGKPSLITVAFKCEKSILQHHEISSKRPLINSCISSYLSDKWLLNYFSAPCTFRHKLIPYGFPLFKTYRPL